MLVSGSVNPFNFIAGVASRNNWFEEGEQKIIGFPFRISGILSGPKTRAPPFQKDIICSFLPCFTSKKIHPKAKQFWNRIDQKNLNPTHVSSSCSLLKPSLSSSKTPFKNHNPPRPHRFLAQKKSRERPPVLETWFFLVDLSNAIGSWNLNHPRIQVPKIWAIYYKSLT